MEWAFTVSESFNMRILYQGREGSMSDAVKTQGNASVNLLYVDLY